MFCCFISLVLLPSFLASVAAQASKSSSASVVVGGQASKSYSPIFYLNSTSAPRWIPSNLTSMNINSTDGSQLRPLLVSRKKSLGFVCGFYCIDSCSSFSLSVVVIGDRGNPSVVWSANGNKSNNLVQDNSTLQLTKDKGLILQDSNGNPVWSTRNDGFGNDSIAGMNMTENGNLVLFNSKGAVLWQSFDYPTDTLLSGQRLYERQSLFSVSSAENWTQGLYFVTLSMSSGFSAFTQVGNGDRQMYYRLEPQEQAFINGSSLKGHCRLVVEDEAKNSTSSSNSTASSSSNYADLQSGGFLVNLGTSEETTLDSYVEYLRLESDGHLKLYRHSENAGPSEIIDLVSQDLGACQHPRSCGDFSVCSEGKCSCPNDYFVPKGNACSRKTPLSCGNHNSPNEDMVEVKNVSYFSVIDTTSAVPNIKGKEECKQACLKNCSCSAAFFRQDNNVSNGYCFMPTEVLSIREGEIPNQNFTSATYVKVEKVGNPTSPGGRPGLPPPPRNRRSLTAIIGGASSAVLVIISLSIVLLVAKFRRTTSPGGRPGLPPPPRNRRSLTAIIGGAGSAVLAIISLSIVLLVAKFRRTRGEDDDEGDYIKQVPGMPVRISYEELRLATGDFRERLGGGGFGSVYKGVLRDGTLIAVKRLDKIGRDTRQFLAEVETIGSIHHFNLVRLIGFCAEKSRSLLVYEYMCNGSLENWIFYRDQRPCLNWETRKNVVLDIAKGLTYLHEECRQRIIHLDIKPQNILLDENFNAKISDFGLSKLIDRDDSQVLIPPRGTPGYIAPECGHSRITVKADIYSFGIVLLEIVTGRRNLDRGLEESSMHLLYLLQRKAAEGEDRILDIVEDLEAEEVEEYREEMERMIRIAVWCLQNEPTRRPLMSAVVKALEGVIEVDPNITYKFTHALGGSPLLSAHDLLVSAAPQASVLSNPR